MSKRFAMLKNKAYNFGKNGQEDDPEKTHHEEADP